MFPHSSWWTRWPGSRLAGWQADLVPRQQACHPSLEGLPPPGQPASLVFFGVQTFFTRTSPTTSGHVFCSEEWSKCVNKLLWKSQTGKYAQESDSMTRRVNRFTNTTKLAIYKSSELRGNYWWVFWRMDKWQRWTIHCQPNPLTASNAWFSHFELHPKIVPWEIFPFECIISMFSYNVSKGCIPNVKVAHSWHRSNIVKLKGFASFCVRKSRITRFLGRS